MWVYFVAINEYYRGKNQRYDQTPVGEAILEKNAITLLEYGGWFLTAVKCSETRDLTILSWELA